MNLRAYASPYFVSRYIKDRDVKKYLEKYSFKGDVIDIGCGSMPYKKYFKSSFYKGIDFKNYSEYKDAAKTEPDFYFGKKYKADFLLPFKKSEFDHAVSFQVIEHHPEPGLYLSEMSRVVKPNGLILMTAPFMGGLHEEPHDYQRLTKYQIYRNFEKVGLEILEFKIQGSIWSTIAMLLNEQNNSFASKNKLKLFIAIVFHAILLPISYFSLILDKLFPSETIYSNYLVLARKKKVGR